MQLYVVERYLVGWTEEEVRRLVARTADTAPAMAQAGVRYLASIVIPADETCLALFEGPDGAAVHTVNVEHELPIGRVLTGTLSGVAELAEGDA